MSSLALALKLLVNGIRCLELDTSPLLSHFKKIDLALESIDRPVIAFGKWLLLVGLMSIERLLICLDLSTDSLLRYNLPIVYVLSMMVEYKVGCLLF